MATFVQVGFTTRSHRYILSVAADLSRPDYKAVELGPASTAVEETRGAPRAGARWRRQSVLTTPARWLLLDLGCGWGPIAFTLAAESPHGTVWAVDDNERALDLVRRNASVMGLTNVNAVLPGDLPADVAFMTIWSNPPIRVGKDELHAMLRMWLPRLSQGADAWLVVQKNLGSDSLHRWLEASFSPDDFSFSRAATKKGYRVLRCRRR